MKPLPEFAANLRRAVCQQHNCTAALNFADPCVECPNGHFGKASHSCRNEPPLPFIAPPFSSRGKDGTKSAVGGPGTELKAMLGKLGIYATGSCSCDRFAADMDRQGPEWCSANIETIVSWMAAEAKVRRLPFSHVAGVQIVRAAIWNARRKARASAVRP